MGNENEYENIILPEAIEIDPWPNMVKINENKWQQIFIIKLETDIFMDMDYDFKFIEEEIQNKIIYYLNNDKFLEEYKWTCINEDDLEIKLNIQGNNLLLIEIITGKYSNYDPFFTFVPILSLV